MNLMRIIRSFKSQRKPAVASTTWQQGRSRAYARCVSNPSGSQRSLRLLKFNTLNPEQYMFQIPAEASGRFDHENIPMATPRAGGFKSQRKPAHSSTKGFNV